MSLFDQACQRHSYIVLLPNLVVRLGDALVSVARLTFLSHFIICLACAGMAFFAWVNGVPQTIWATDMSMMTSAIGALFVGSAVWLGWQAWQINGLTSDGRAHTDTRSSFMFHVSSDYGHLAERLCVMAGFVGTAIGLSLQAKSLASGATSFAALGTSLFTTASGGAAAALIAIMTFNLETGNRRMQRLSESQGSQDLLVLGPPSVRKAASAQRCCSTNET
jgi:hypothetical protein